MFKLFFFSGDSWFLVLVLVLRQVMFCVSLQYWLMYCALPSMIGYVLCVLQCTLMYSALISIDYVVCFSFFLYFDVQCSYLCSVSLFFSVFGVQCSYFDRFLCIFVSIVLCGYFDRFRCISIFYDALCYTPIGSCIFISSGVSCCTSIDSGVDFSPLVYSAIHR